MTIDITVTQADVGDALTFKRTQQALENIKTLGERFEAADGSELEHGQTRNLLTRYAKTYQQIDTYAGRAVAFAAMFELLDGESRFNTQHGFEHISRVFHWFETSQRDIARKQERNPNDADNAIKSEQMRGYYDQVNTSFFQMNDEKYDLVIRDFELLGNTKNTGALKKIHSRLDAYWHKRPKT